MMRTGRLGYIGCAAADPAVQTTSATATPRCRARPDGACLAVALVSGVICLPGRSGTEPLLRICSSGRGGTRQDDARNAPFGAREPQNFDQIHAKSRKELRRNLAEMMFFVAF